MSYQQAMRHRPHKLNIGHTFNPSGVEYRVPHEPESRVRCPGCGRKFAASTVRWVVLGEPGERMCKRCNDRRIKG